MMNSSLGPLWMTAFPSLGIGEMDIVQALLFVLVYLAWRAFTLLRSAGRELGAELPKIARQIRRLEFAAGIEIQAF